MSLENQTEIEDNEVLSLEIHLMQHGPGPGKKYGQGKFISLIVLYVFHSQIRY